MSDTYRPLAAAAWMSGSILSFSSMAIAGRSLARTRGAFVRMASRSLIGFVLVLTVGGLAGRLGEVRANRIGTHLIRNLFHFAGQNLWFWSLTMIPLAQVFALEFTSPLWVILLSPLFLGERLTPARAASATLGFVGVLIVARPDIAHINPGILAAAASAIGFAGSAIFTKRLTFHEQVISILFWLTVMQGLFGLALSAADGDVTLPGLAEAPALLVVGAAGVIAHFCLTKALTLAPASIVIPIDFVRLPMIAIVAMFLYGEPLDPAVFLGAAIICLANWWNIRSEDRRQKVAS